MSRKEYSIEIEFGSSSILIELASNAPESRKDQFKDMLDHIARRCVESKPPNISSVYDRLHMTFDINHQAEVKDYCLSAAAMLLKQGPTSSQLPSLQCVSLQDGRLKVYYKINLNLYKTP